MGWMIDRESFRVFHHQGNTVDFDVVINLDGGPLINDGSYESLQGIYRNRQLLIVWLNAIQPVEIVDGDAVLWKVETRLDNEVLFSKVATIDIIEAEGVRWARFPISMNHPQAQTLPVGRHRWDFTIYTQPTFSTDPEEVDSEGKPIPINGVYVNTPFRWGTVPPWQVYESITAGVKEED